MLLAFSAAEIAGLDAALAFAEADELAQATELNAANLPRCARIHLDRARTYAAARRMIAGKVSDATTLAAE